jgi:predicted DNA-binding protein (UPF0251 family)
MDLEEVTLAFEELEALRLAHQEGLYQQDAALRMGVSRATFGRVLDSAHRKVTQALVGGLALRIEGGGLFLEFGFRALSAKFVLSTCFKTEYAGGLPASTRRSHE